MDPKVGSTFGSDAASCGKVDPVFRVERCAAQEKHRMDPKSGVHFWVRCAHRAEKGTRFSALNGAPLEKTSIEWGSRKGGPLCVRCSTPPSPSVKSVGASGRPAPRRRAAVRDTRSSDRPRGRGPRRRARRAPVSALPDGRARREGRLRTRMEERDVQQTHRDEEDLGIEGGIDPERLRLCGEEHQAGRHLEGESAGRHRDGDAPDLAASSKRRATSAVSNTAMAPTRRAAPST